MVTLNAFDAQQRYAYEIGQLRAQIAAATAAGNATQAAALTSELNARVAGVFADPSAAYDGANDRIMARRWSNGDPYELSVAALRAGIATANVRDYGAIGDGVADDTAAIQDALDSLTVRGGRLYFPSGEYRTTAALVVPAFVHLFGDRTTVTTKGSVIRLRDSNVNLFNIADGDWCIENLVLWGNAGSAAGTGHLLNLGVAGGAFCSGGYLRNVRLYEAPQAAINLSNAGDTVIDSCGFESNNYGILGNDVGGVASDIRIVGSNVFYANYQDLYVTYANRWLVQSALFQLTGSPAFGTDATQYFGGTSTSVSVLGCIFDRPGGALRIDGGSLNIVANNKWVEPKRSAVILSLASSYNIVEGNSLLNGSQILANTHDGISVGSTSGFNVIRNNQIVLGFRYGINIVDATCPQNSVRGNVVSSCASGSYLNASATTRLGGNDFGDGRDQLAVAGLYPPTPAAAAQAAAAAYAGTGAPNNADGANGDFYLRGDGGALTTIYQKRAGAWVGIV